MAFIKKLEDALCNGELLDALEKKASSELEKMAKETGEFNEKLVNLLWGRFIQCDLRLIRNYFPKIGGEKYAIELGRYIKFYKKYWDDPQKTVDKKLSKKEIEEIQSKGALHRTNLATCLKALLFDSSPRLIALGIICLKELYEDDFDDEIYAKIQLLYSLPSFRNLVAFLCENTPKFEKLALLYHLGLEENKEYTSFVATMLKEHRVNENNPSIRDYVLSKDTDHQVKLPLDYFNNVIFDDRLNRYDFAMGEGFTEMLVGERVSEEDKLQLREKMKNYLQEPTDENLIELNVFSERFIGSPSVQDYLLDLLFEHFESLDDKTAVKGITETEKAILGLYLNSRSILCVKVAIMGIGRVLTYRPYFMPIYKEFERIACCEELSNVALEACQHVITIPTSRLQDLYKEFSQFGKMLIINYMPKDSVVKRNVIKNFAFQNTAYPSLMAQKLMKTKELKLREMLLGEEPCGFDIFYINGFVEEYLKNGVSVFLREKDFFRLMRGYTQIHPTGQSYHASTLTQIFNIFATIDKKVAKDFEKVWVDYTYKDGQLLMKKIKKLLQD